MNATVAAHAKSAHANSRSAARDLVALTKPRITMMVTATGVAAALTAPVRPHLARGVSALVGTLLVVAGANTLNMWIERHSDALMERTRDRPLAAGRISPNVGLAFGLLLSLASMPALLFAGPLVMWLGLCALVLYAGVYTPMKRFTRWSLPVGAIAGAMPPAMGWVAGTGSVDLGAIYLFLVLFTWQLPHFVAISIARDEDYRRGGLAVYASRAAGVALVASSCAFVVVTLLAPLARIGHGRAVVVSAVTGLGLVALSVRAARRGTPASARDVFAWTMGHLAIVLTALGVDR